MAYQLLFLVRPFHLCLQTSQNLLFHQGSHDCSVLLLGQVVPDHLAFQFLLLVHYYLSDHRDQFRLYHPGVQVHHDLHHYQVGH